MKKIDMNNLPLDVSNHSYQNTEKINEIIEWINNLGKIANKTLKGH